jgi:hypothetical protein
VVVVLSSVAGIQVAPPPFEPIPGTYDPAKRGVALYMSVSGQQGRYVRRYEPPPKEERDKKTACTHLFVAKQRRTGGIFSWFCPHGFGYGTSIIKAAEGRRDPFQSLYTHCEVAPRVIIYDFACSLSEFAKNSEFVFFKETQ